MKAEDKLKSCSHIFNSACRDDGNGKMIAGERMVYIFFTGTFICEDGLISDNLLKTTCGHWIQVH